MIHYKQHIIFYNQDARSALRALETLPENASRTLFVLNADNKLVGVITDGDIRRGLLDGREISDPAARFMNTQFKYLKESKYSVDEIKKFKQSDIYLIPIVDDTFELIDVVDLKNIRSLLPLTALIMAGGRGERLRPLTDVAPKPMLKVGAKPIIEHNIDRLIKFGVSEIFISVNYLKEQLIEYFGDGSKKGISIKYIEEDKPLGTLGSLSLIETVAHDDILVMNSDLLTNIDFEAFFLFYKEHRAQMAVASIPYTVNVPYAVLKTNDHHIESFVEKPSYTYYSNGGIYLFDFELRKLIRSNTFYNATDLMNKLIADDVKNLVHYPLLCYWLDIGKYEDYRKAQEDINYISL
ncbi:MAG TPA: nucleotidyltransferase family protein [Chryseolinea sp.]